MQRGKTGPVRECMHLWVAKEEVPGPEQIPNPGLSGNKRRGVGSKPITWTRRPASETRGDLSGGFKVTVVRS